MLLSKKDFIKLIEGIQGFSKYLDKLDDLKVYVIESELHEYPYRLFDFIIGQAFDEDGEDWINYYLYELPSLGEGDHVFGKDGTVIPLKNIDDLWELVKDYRK